MVMQGPVWSLAGFFFSQLVSFLVQQDLGLLIDNPKLVFILILIHA